MASTSRAVEGARGGHELGRSGTHTKHHMKSFLLTVRLRRPLTPGAPLVVLIRGTNKDYRNETPYVHGFRYRLLRTRH